MKYIPKDNIYFSAVCLHFFTNILAVCLLFLGREIDEMAEGEDNANDINDDENYSFEQEEGDTDLTYMNDYYEVSEGLFTFFTFCLHFDQLFVSAVCLFFFVDNDQEVISGDDLYYEEEYEKGGYGLFTFFRKYQQFVYILISCLFILIFRC